MKVTVTVKECCMVRPAEDTPNRRLWLSNLDQLFVTYPHVSLLHPYKHDGSGNFFDARVMKESLAKALVAFFPVAGRLAQDESGRFELDCSGQGVPFAEAEIDVPMSELGDFSSPQLLTQLFLQVDRSKAISSFPLFLVKVTRFRCGGVRLGIGLQHVLCDGEGLSNLLTAWSNLACNLPITDQPFLDRTCLRSTVLLPGSQPMFQHPEYQESSTDPNPTTPSPPQFMTSTQIQKISAHQIKHLKDQTNNNYSTYEVMAAHIWRCVTIARRFADQNQPTTLYVSVDGRSRFNPPLPRAYFGNCVFHAMPVASPAELFSESLEQTAERIRRAVRMIDEEYMRSAIAYLERSGDGTTRVRIPGTSGSPHLKVITWARLSFGKDFGWGKPFFTRSINRSEGKCHILPNDEDGNVPLSLCLEPATMERFKTLLMTTLPQHLSLL